MSRARASLPAALFLGVLCALAPVALLLVAVGVASVPAGAGQCPPFLAVLLPAWRPDGAAAACVAAATPHPDVAPPALLARIVSLRI